tara:strand:- start:835 stop:987 length:153 start_codon:yes stop_codon:yes gene_type:complete
MAKNKSKKKDLVEKKELKTPVSKWVEKDAHVQHITARPKTIVNQRERRPQ